MIVPIIDKAIGLATEIFKNKNIKDGMKYAEEMVNLRQKINDERAKGDDADDSEIENCYKRIEIIFDIALSQSK